MKMSRKELLEKSIDVVTKDRNEQYGGVEDNFNLIAKYWSTYLNTEITGHDVAIMMTFLKLARIQTGKFHSDNYVDIAGYIACACEIAS